MEGYIIVGLNEDSSEPSNYWDGNSMQKDIARATLYPEKRDARTAAATVQSRLADIDVIIKKAKLTVVIVDSSAS